MLRFFDRNSDTFFLQKYDTFFRQKKNQQKSCTFFGKKKRKKKSTFFEKKENNIFCDPKSSTHTHYDEPIFSTHIKNIGLIFPTKLNGDAFLQINSDLFFSRPKKKRPIFSAEIKIVSLFNLVWRKGIVFSQENGVAFCFVVALRKGYIFFHRYRSSVQSDNFYILCRDRDYRSLCVEKMGPSVILFFVAIILFL